MSEPKIENPTRPISYNKLDIATTRVESAEIRQEDREILNEWANTVQQKYILPGLIPNGDILKKILNDTRSQPFDDYMPNNKVGLKLSEPEIQTLNNREKTEVALALSEFVKIWSDIKSPINTESKHYFLATIDYDGTTGSCKIVFHAIQFQNLRNDKVQRPEKFRRVFIDQFQAMVFYANRVGYDI
jgi:hypothetical protein